MRTKCGYTASIAVPVLPFIKELGHVSTIDATVPIDIGVCVADFPFKKKSVYILAIDTAITIEVGDATRINRELHGEEFAGHMDVVRVDEAEGRGEHITPVTARDVKDRVVVKEGRAEDHRVTYSHDMYTVTHKQAGVDGHELCADI